MRSEYHEGLKSLNRDQAVQIGLSSVLACDHVRLLELIISAELSLDRHVSFVTSFYWLRQLRASKDTVNSGAEYRISNLWSHADCESFQKQLATNKSPDERQQLPETGDSDRGGSTSASWGR